MFLLGKQDEKLFCFIKFFFVYKTVAITAAAWHIKKKDPSGWNGPFTA